MARKVGRPDNAFQAAYDFIRANPYTRLIEVARATGASERTIRRVRDKLREEGLLKPYASSPLPKIDRTKMFKEPLTPVSNDPMTAEELHQEISRKIRSARNTEEFRPLAESLLKMLPKPETEDASLGPVEPLSHEEMIERGGLMLRSLGPDLSIQAVEWARAEVTAEGIPAEAQETNADHTDPV